MRKIFEWTKKWSVVIMLTIYIGMMACAAVCCIFSAGKAYPDIGGVAVAVTIFTAMYQLIVEWKRTKGGL